MEQKDVVVISAVRTPMGRFGGTLKDVATYDLGAHAIRAALDRIGTGGSTVNEVVYGCCRQAGNGPNPSRTAAVRGGIPIEVSTQTINMACPSGMKTLALASQAIRLNDSAVVMAGGMDSMSTIPYLLKGVRWQGFKMGDRVLEDGWSDSIDPLCGVGMGVTAENLAVKYGITRQEQDAYALESHRRAGQAREKGLFDEEIAPMTLPGEKGTEPLVFKQDESIRPDTTLEKLARLKPAFKKDGTVTPGNACGMTDGATALIVTSRAKARVLGFQPLFSIVSYVATAVKPEEMGDGPSRSIPLALERASMNLSDMDLIEVNEAFAVQILANERILKWDRSRLNVHGGAIALGHPTGISGARIVVTLYHALKTHGKELGLAGICGGGGVSMAMVIKREP